MDLKNKLLAIQQELKAPKGRTNYFGGYYYRSTEDILTALKPLLQKQKVILTITDSMELIGDRYYVKATACLEDVESDTGISVSAYAREALERKKSDDSQLTGAASSYARKYALNGLFLIDDSADPDTYEDDPDQEAVEEAPAPARKPRQKKEAAEDTVDHDRYYYIEEEDNVKMIRAGDPAPEGGKEITKEQYASAATAIALEGKNASAKEAIDDAPEEEPKTRRSRRKR